MKYLQKHIDKQKISAIIKLKVKESQSQKTEAIKMKLSNIIEEFIKEMLEEESMIELQRNELASKFNCVPSQINYVISTRFSPERGYSVESRRGGGGYIKITKVGSSDRDYILRALRLIGDYISQQDMAGIIESLYEYEFISKREAKIIIAALSDNSLIIKQPERDVLRAKILKNILVNL